MAELYLALIHHPVVNKKGDTVGSAVTNMDLHDIARAARTFGVKGYYVVTPYPDQAALCQQIMAHWTQGAGATANPARKSALERIRISDCFESMCKEIQAQESQGLVKVATSARPYENTVSCKHLKRNLNEHMPHVIVFGTAWGLADEIIEQCDYILEPISGAGSYNHLSVRSAASIYLDRLING